MEETHELTSTDLYSPRVAYESYVSSKTDPSFFSYDVDLLGKVRISRSFLPKLTR
ncbi:hypothetical protein AI3049V1_5313 (plasmid) [Klebsiella pneumoniae]|nr:hypothetical protein AI3044V1_5315 [Klebsiella pneumoniae]CAF9630781.1 hypothetical protein AI3049V1_5313 [Klebsiella pneumoniae]CAH6282269.1 hypothetical protein AI3049V1_5313 [Klebsiella pneumoniae]CAH6282443.1 hypothetical protein AI3044V1_5315 [Klebsiella pneumoniae]